MYRDTISQNFQRYTICHKPTQSKSKIKIQKNKLPVNFFKPLSIEIIEQQQSNQKSIQQPLPTPCFGNHISEDSRQKVQQQQIVNNHPVLTKLKKQQFYSWFSKSNKPLSSRLQTVPVEVGTSHQKKRHQTQRKRRMERVKSVQQYGGKISANKIFQKHQNLLIPNKILQTINIDKNKEQSIYRSKLKAVNIQGIQQSYKNHFKINNKRGLVEAKYRQNKALNSLINTKTNAIFLPSIVP